MYAGRRRAAASTAVVAAGLALVIGARPADAAAKGHTPATPTKYPPSSCVLGIKSSTVIPGQSIRITGTGFRPRTIVSVTFASPDVFNLGNVRANRYGSFELISAIPETATQGRHQVRAVPGAACQSATVTVSSSDQGLRPGRATDESPASSSSRLSTGSEIALGVAIGGVLLVGVGSTAVGRRRRRS
ncbi:hypothetical protein [Jatrophihabitans endophyticus]|nr:hypothetical protein [Jatrophihabitans endophyticus]